MLTSILKLILTKRLNPFVFYKPRKDILLKYSSSRIGLYIHIPFCRQICSFCPYFKVLYNKEHINRFVAALTKEIKIISDKYPKKISSIYFGGGTPALLIDELEGIVTTINENFNTEGNLAIELHPNNLTDDTLSKLKKYGFNMISIGIQSFSSKCLESLERGNEVIGEGLEEKLRRVKNYNFDVIDADIIFGIPGQTGKDLEIDFKKAEELGVSQISTYPFIDFSYADNKKKPQDRRQKKKLLDVLSEVAEKSSFVRTSVWTFAKKGSKKYSSVTRDNYIGLGPSAASLADNIFKINTFSVEEYIKSIEEKRDPTSLVMEFDFKTRAAYWLFWSCYNLELDSNIFRDLFSKELSKEYYWELLLSEKLGFLKKSSTGYRLTKKGAYVFHLVEQKYTHQYIDKTWNMALKDPWPEEIKLY